MGGKARVRCHTIEGQSLKGGAKLVGSAFWGVSDMGISM